jgi:iron complex outermembrane receptor protein
LAGRTLKDDGYVYDELLGRNVNNTSQQAVRASLLANPTSDLEMLISYEYFHEDDGGVGTFVNAISGAASNNAPAFRAARGYRPLEDLLAEQQDRGIYRIASGTPAFVKIDAHLATGTVSYQLSDSVTFKDILAYRHVKDDLRDDLDGTESSIFPQERLDRSWQVSNEFQIIGQIPRFDWIAGLYYFQEQGRLQAYSASNAVDPGPIEYESLLSYPDVGLSVTDAEARNVSYAAFAQGTYEVIDGLKLTAGLRFNRDERRSTIRNRFPRGACRFTIDADRNPATPEVTPTLDQCIVVGNKSFSEPTYNLSLDYRLDDDKLVYAAHRHGYRSGGFGSRATSEVGLTRTYAPETVDDFEIGFKANWHLGNAFLRTNLAAYTADYKNIQRVLTDASFTPPQSVTVNAASARIRGIEADILVRPVPWIDLTANYAYTDTKFKDFVTPTGIDLSESPLARAPKHVYTLGAQVTIPTSADVGEISFGGSYYHHGSYNADDAYVAGVTDMPSYNLVNLDVAWRRIAGSDFDLSATVTNLTKERYSYYVANLLGLGVLPHFAGEPRRFMATLRYQFGS